MPEMEKAVANYALDSYYTKAFDLVSSGRARNASRTASSSAITPRELGP